jgi:predicted ribosome quality control (RQC) complex YloA/Tae2 family protein
LCRTEHEHEFGICSELENNFSLFVYGGMLDAYLLIDYNSIAMNVELEQVIGGVNEILPAELQKVGLLAGRALVLRLVVNDRSWYLYLVPGSFRAVCFCEDSPGKTYPHAEWLGPHLHVLEHRMVTSVTCIAEENVIAIQCDNGMALYVHFLGSDGNAVLVDAENRIMVSWHKAKYYSAGTEYVRAGTPGSGHAPIHVLPHDQLVTDLEILELEDIRQQVSRFLAAEHKRLIRRMERIERDLTEADNGEIYRQWGELLKANYHLLKRGMTEVCVTDYFSPDMPDTVIPLNTAKTPQENVSAYFHRAQKAIRAKEKVRERIEITRNELELNEQNRLRCPDIDDIQQLRALLPHKRKVKKRVVRAKDRKEPGLRKYTSSDGFTILAGKNARENDYLTVRLAHGNDTWMHTRNRAGSHVVIRSGKREVPRRTLIEAAQVCAGMSKVPDGEVVEITYALRKHVSKPKGAKPGLVMVAGGKTLGIRYDEKAIKQWMQEHRDG